MSDHDHNLIFRYKYGGDIPAAKMFLINTEVYRERYRLGYDIPDDMLCHMHNCDHVQRYVNGHNLCAEYTHILADRDHFSRYISGYAISANLNNVLNENCHRARFRAGFEPISKLEHGPYPSDYSTRYHNGGNIPESIICEDFDHQIRFQHGHAIPLNLIHILREIDYAKRETHEFDPKFRPYELSYLLGYNIPDNIQVNLTWRDRWIHENYSLNAACRTALADALFAISYADAADFEYVTGLAAPTWLELRDPAGEVVFRDEDPASCAAAGARINQICDHLCSPEWGARRVGDMRGTVLLEPAD